MLNRTEGEKIEGLGDAYRVVELTKWSDTDFWQIACMQAAQAFHKVGALLPITFDRDDVLVQEYPMTAPPKIVFLFCRRVARAIHYYPAVFDLSPATIADLKVSNRWTDTVH